MDIQPIPVWVVIPAAGLGQRMGSEYPKQYIKIHNKTLIEHTIDCFKDIEQIAGIVVILNSEDRYWNTINVSLSSTPIHTVYGGAERSDSVLKGLKYLSEEIKIEDKQWVMIHDAARPCLSKTDINALLAIQEKDCDGGILASPVRDTMKRTFTNKDHQMPERISHTEPRENLWHALTPQMFRLGEIIEAIQFCQENNESITDECSAMERRNVKPVIVEGSHNNIKVTYPSDIELVSVLLSNKIKGNI